MQKQPFLFIIVILLVVIVGLLAYGPQTSDESLGQKVGNTIDRATGERN